MYNQYDDPANCAPEDDQYGSQYGGPYGAPYDHYGSRGSVGRRSVGTYIYILPVACKVYVPLEANAEMLP